MPCGAVSVNLYFSFCTVGSLVGYFSFKTLWAIVMAVNVSGNVTAVCVPHVMQDYVILDEGHKIKNPSTKSAKGVHFIRARNRIVLSGTPLMNNLKVSLSLIV